MLAGSVPLDGVRPRRALQPVVPLSGYFFLSLSTGEGALIPAVAEKRGMLQPKLVGHWRAVPFPVSTNLAVHLCMHMCMCTACKLKSLQMMTSSAITYELVGMHLLHLSQSPKRNCQKQQQTSGYYRLGIPSILRLAGMPQRS
jgi:hypothetical protein